MNREKFGKILPYACLIFSIIAYPAICRWYVSVIFQVLTIVSGVYYYHAYGDRSNQKVSAGLRIIAVLIALEAIFLLSWGIYMAIIL